MNVRGMPLKALTTGFVSPEEHEQIIEELDRRYRIHYFNFRRYQKRHKQGKYRDEKADA